MKIYTKSGDAGETGLFGGGRVVKDHPRVEAYGEVDELNSTLGLARALGLDPALDSLLETLQQQLFTLGAVLATPPATKAAAAIPKLQPEWVADMEAAIDRFETELAPLTQFVLPGGGRGAAALHLARTVCRRAERRVVHLTRDATIDGLPVIYLNRLSDFLFVAARLQNKREQIPDVHWMPAKP